MQLEDHDAATHKAEGTQGWQPVVSALTMRFQHETGAVSCQEHPS